MGAVVAEHGATWVLMHMRGTPATMQSDTHYDDLVQEVVAGLRAKLEAAQAAGVPRTSLWVDPGIGFGKAMLDNPHLVRATPVLVEQLGRPVLIGASRKAFVGRLVGEPEPGARVHGSVGVALAAHLHGAAMLRVHDVRATRHALLAFEACR
jgi:dihydropteroate synthase